VNIRTFVVLYQKNMENNIEETSAYRPRTGSLERRKIAAAPKRTAKSAEEKEERAPRTRKEPTAEETPIKRTSARQSFFKNRTPQAEQQEERFDEKPKRTPRKSYDYDAEKPTRTPRKSYDDYAEKPKRAPRKSYDDYAEKPTRTPRKSYGDYAEKPTRRLYAGDNERPAPRRKFGERDVEEKPKRRTSFDAFSKERPRTERRSSAYGERSEKPFARKPFGEKSYGDKPRRTFDEDKPRRTFGEDKPRSARPPYERKPFERKPYGEDKKPFERKPYGRKPYGETAFADTKRPRRTFEDRPKTDIRILERKPKAQVKDPTAPVRLNKFIANSGVCSRREADEYIQNGEISVNGEVVTVLGTKVQPADDIRWNGERLSGEKKVYVLLNKPKGYVTTVEDPHADRTVMDLIDGACSERVYPVGRLDKNSTGVLLFTNDGELTKQLTHPSYNKRKVYHVVLDKTLKKPDMDKLVSGIELEDGLAVADEVGYANLEDKTEVGVEIHSGRNRIVRRMFEALGYEVKKLDRVYFAGLTKKSLERGKWRILTPKEVSILKMGAYE
jgi:23S rRNA pseudouridine2605 synthase